ncbi:MAG: hypothetical protein JST28_06415 [Acidobacteria bacterium]|nr:hypothetical protein [Acidobacteriota bacterium]
MASIKHRPGTTEEKRSIRDVSTEQVLPDMLRTTMPPTGSFQPVQPGKWGESISVDDKKSVPLQTSNDDHANWTRVGQADLNDRVQSATTVALSAKGKGDDAGDGAPSAAVNADLCRFADLPRHGERFTKDTGVRGVSDRAPQEAIPAGATDSTAPSRSSAYPEIQAPRSRERGIRDEAERASTRGKGEASVHEKSAVGIAEWPMRSAWAAPVEWERFRTADVQKTPGPAAVACDRSELHPEQRWTHTGKSIAEAGFQDSALGWISVRAERDSSGLHAVVVPASHDAVRVLSGHLSGLNAHLAATQVPVSPVTILGTHEASMSMGYGGDNQRGGSGAQRHEEHEAPRRAGNELAEITPTSPLKLLENVNRNEGSTAHAGANGFSGIHVSLVA